MRISLRLFTSRVIAITLTGAIAVILLGGNFTLINAQQSQTDPPSANQNTAQVFQKPDEGFGVHVPNGWIIQDVNNSGSTLEAEELEGVGVLAQLCLEEGQSQQAGAASGNTGGSS